MIIDHQHPWKDGWGLLWRPASEVCGWHGSTEGLG